MDGQNVVAARVALTDGMVRADSNEGVRFQFAPCGAVRACQDLRFTIRRDKIARSPGDAVGLNAIGGKVTNVEYQGTFVKVELAPAK